MHFGGHSCSAYSSAELQHLIAMNFVRDDAGSKAVLSTEEVQWSPLGDFHQ